MLYVFIFFMVDRRKLKLSKNQDTVTVRKLTKVSPIAMHPSSSSALNDT